MTVEKENRKFDGQHMDSLGFYEIFYFLNTKRTQTMNIMNLDSY